MAGIAIQEAVTSVGGGGKSCTRKNVQVDWREMIHNTDEAKIHSKERDRHRGRRHIFYMINYGSLAGTNTPF